MAKYKIRDIILFKEDKEAIVITNINEEENTYYFSFIKPETVDAGYYVSFEGMDKMGGQLIGNDLLFNTIRLLYL